MNNFPPDLAFELWKISKKIGKPIYAGYCSCGMLSMKGGEFTEEEKLYCPKCNPKPINRALFLAAIFALILATTCYLY